MIRFGHAKLEDSSDWSDPLAPSTYHPTEFGADSSGGRSELHSGQPVDASEFAENVHSDACANGAKKKQVSEPGRVNVSPGPSLRWRGEGRGRGTTDNRSNRGGAHRAARTGVLDEGSGRKVVPRLDQVFQDR